MAFFEVEFPRKIAYGMTGGGVFNTSVNEGFSGFEQRNRNWAKARGKWSATVSCQQNGDNVITDFDLLRNFQLVVGGMADAFRLYEPTDHAASMQDGTGIIGTGTGAQTAFQLVKVYRLGTRTYTRKVTKPITDSVKDYQGNTLANTVTVYVNGIAKTLTTDYTIDYTTGIITFVSAPALGAIIAADFEFHIPARFTADEFTGVVEVMNADTGKALVSVTLELMEIRL